MLTTGGAETVLYSFGASSVDAVSPGRLVLGPGGNLYGITADGGAYGDGSVFKITPAGVETILYSFGASTSDGQSPSNLLQASNGNLYGTTLSGGNFGGGTLFEVTPTGTMTMLYASFGFFSTGSGCPSGLDPPNGAGPLGMTLSSDSVFYGFTGGGACYLDGVIFDLAP